MIEFKNKRLVKLKQNPEYADIVTPLLIPGEIILEAFKSMRDGVVFTDRRLILVDKKGITGTKIELSIIPYKSIIAHAIETAGTFDIDSELKVFLSGSIEVKFEFRSSTSLIEISKEISKY